MATGSDSGNSGSESWLKYLNRSPSGEGTENSEAEPASRKRSSDPTEGVGPSSAPGDGQQPQGEVDQPAANVMGAEAPDLMWLKNHIERGFRTIKGRKPQERVLNPLFDDLKLETASPQKRLQIVRILNQMKMDDSLKGKDFRLDLELGVRIHNWEREQSHFPNPVDDVP